MQLEIFDISSCKLHHHLTKRAISLMSSDMQRYTPIYAAINSDIYRIHLSHEKFDLSPFLLRFSFEFRVVVEVASETLKIFSGCLDVRERKAPKTPWLIWRVSQSELLGIKADEKNETK